MKIAYLITPKTKKISYNPNYTYIGVDKGAWIAMQQKIPLEIAIGDFDSISQEDRFHLKTYCKMHIAKVDKDETDIELAISYAKTKGFQTIIVDGVCRGRLDHTLNNMQLLIENKSYLQIQDDHHHVQCFGKGRHVILKKKRYLSFFALEDSKVNIIGVKFPLVNKLICTKDKYLISNEIVDDEAILDISYGSVLCIQSEDCE